MRIPSFRPLIAATALLASAGVLHAETAGRFTMSPTDGGFVRLDKETGAMSLCTKKDGNWTCNPMADDERDLRKELDRLKSENGELRGEVRRLEDTFVGGRRPDAPADGETPPLAGPPGGLPKGGLPNLELPSEEQVDKAVDYLEGMIRKFRERFEDFGDKTDPDRPRSRPRRDEDGDRGGDSRGTTPL
ncbi:MAG: hypothetical protein K0U74_00215 [Alphaproteobacteria bacterium]|nr:hypothetical protein [Alphaproteobacteria bacterium]